MTETHDIQISETEAWRKDGWDCVCACVDRNIVKTAVEHWEEIGLEVILNTRGGWFYVWIKRYIEVTFEKWLITNYTWEGTYWKGSEQGRGYSTEQLYYQFTNQNNMEA